MAENPKENPHPEQVGKRMTIAEHLDELRKRLVRASLAVVLVFAVSWAFVDEVMEFLMRPHYEAMQTLQVTYDRRQAEGVIKAVLKRTQDAKAQEALKSVQDLLDGKKLADAVEDVKKKFPETSASGALQSVLEEYRNLPRAEVDRRPIVTTYTESITTYMKACFILALLIAGPYVLWEIWGFIAAGLYLKEKKFVRYYFPLSLVLFFFGIAFGYYILIPIGLEFLINFGSDLVRPEIRISDYFSLFLTMTFSLGLIFQLPMVMLVLSRMGVVKPESYRGKWKIVILVCFVAAAVVTPTPDPVNQSLLAVSMYLLYELGILLAKLAYRERQKATENP